MLDKQYGKGTSQVRLPDELIAELSEYSGGDRKRFIKLVAAMIEFIKPAVKNLKEERGTDTEEAIDAILNELWAVQVPVLRGTLENLDQRSGLTKLHHFSQKNEEENAETPEPNEEVETEESQPENEESAEGEGSNWEDSIELEDF